MSLRRIWLVAQRVWTGLYRDRRALPALLLVPIGTVLLIGYVMRSADDDVTVGLVATANEWQVRDAAGFIEQTFDNDGIKHARFSDVAAADRALHDGDADAYVVLDDAFVRGVLNNSQEEITVGLRGDNKGASDTALVAIGHALSDAPLRVLNASLGGQPAPGEPLNLDTRYVYAAATYDGLDHIVPAMIAFASFLSIFTISVVAFTQERFTRTMERMLASAASRSEIVLGYMLGYLAEAALQTALILAVVVVVFHVSYSGSLLLVGFVTLIGGLAALTLGLLLSAFARTEQQAMQMLAIVLVPQLVLAGVLFPLEDLPASLRVAAHALPMTYTVAALRDVMIRGFSLSDADVLLNLGVLLAFVAAFLALGVRTLREAT